MDRDIKAGDNAVIIAVKCCSKKQFHPCGTVFTVGKVEVYDQRTVDFAKGLGIFKCECGQSFVPDPCIYVWDNAGRVVVPLECIKKLGPLSEEEMTQLLKEIQDEHKGTERASGQDR
jgi:hypothetical protein